MLYDSGLAVQFHKVIAPKCHEISKIEEWFAKEYDGKNVTVNRIVE